MSLVFSRVRLRPTVTSNFGRKWMPDVNTRSLYSFSESDLKLAKPMDIQSINSMSYIQALSSLRQFSNVASSTSTIPQTKFYSKSESGPESDSQDSLKSNSKSDSQDSDSQDAASPQQQQYPNLCLTDRLTKLEGRVTDVESLLSKTRSEAAEEKKKGSMFGKAIHMIREYGAPFALYYAFVYFSMFGGVYLVINYELIPGVSPEHVMKLCESGLIKLGWGDLLNTGSSSQGEPKMVTQTMWIQDRFGQMKPVEVQMQQDTSESEVQSEVQTQPLLELNEYTEWYLKLAMAGVINEFLEMPRFFFVAATFKTVMKCVKKGK